MTIPSRWTFAGIQSSSLLYVPVAIVSKIMLDRRDRLQWRLGTTSNTKRGAARLTTQNGEMIMEAEHVMRPLAPILAVSRVLIIFHFLSPPHPLGQAF